MPFDQEDDDLLGYRLRGTSAQSRNPSAGGPTVIPTMQLYGRPSISLAGKDLSDWKSSRVGRLGDYGTVYSESRPEDGLEVVYPRIYGGDIHPSDEAWQHYLQTGEHMGKFRTSEDAETYANQYHLDSAAGVYKKRFAHAKQK